VEFCTAYSCTRKKLHEDCDGENIHDAVTINKIFLTERDFQASQGAQQPLRTGGTLLLSIKPVDHRNI
jgi:hypothetical protein